MTDLSTSFRKVSSALLLTCSLLFVLPAGVVNAAPGGMLSSSATSGTVQESLLVKSDPDESVQGSADGVRKRFSPGKVALISAVLPGYGQIYNHAAWKLPIYYGLMGYFASKAVDNNKKYLDNLYAYRADPNAAGAAMAAADRDKYRKQRNTQIVWFCITYVAGIVDAYVDTQLFGFDKIIDEKVEEAASPLDSAPSLTVSMKF